MNRKDMKNLSKDEPSKKYGVEYGVFWTPEKVEETASNIALKVSQLIANSRATGRELGRMSPSSAWFRMYSSIVGGQVAWLTGAISDPSRFEKRLKTLADVATAAVNYAIREGKIAVSTPKKQDEKEGGR